ncbi:MAG: ABC transporter permease [Verrucomicrobia bacterium]|jgi:lipoprotein-releasing system permease protein|nr:ABC transporter permease [Verrucomicrobiota bacterium]MBT7067550.1 ABC transporter permease [Verrucomicrobiota bacterium]MBT7698707.1 ABC transporter permease [Verrucomicrobiota bacterium]
MRLPFSFFLALKYLRPKRSFSSVVTVISILGVLLGVAILVIVLSVMTGFDNMWRDKILSFKPHLTVTSLYGPVEEEEELCQRIESIEGITGAAPNIQTRVLLQYEGRLSAPVVLGVPSERVARISKVTEHMHRGTFTLDEESIVLGIDLAGSLGIRVGDTVLLYSPMNVVSMDEMYLPEELIVSGIFDMGMRDFDSGFIFTSLGVARDLVGMESGAHGLYVMTADAFRFDHYAVALRDALGPAYDVRTWQQVDSLLFDALAHEKAMMFILLVFITIVAIFCVTNTLIVITVQKTNEIGVLKALGFSSLKIMGAFVWLGWIQCLVGIAGGIGTGLLVLNNLGNIVAALTSIDVEVFPKAIYGLSEIPWSTSASEIINVAVFVMVFCTLSSILPAYRAARLDPVKALRQE